MSHILAEVSGTGSFLEFVQAGSIVKYTGPPSENMIPGDFYVVVGFVDDDCELGHVDSNELYIRGVDARDEVSDNLMVTVSVPRKYWGRRGLFSEYVFIS